MTVTSDAPDLSLKGVAFARTSEGRITTRGTAARLDYRRAGGRVDAELTAMVLFPQPGSQLASYGQVGVNAPHAKGEVTSRRGTAWGGVDFASSRGDRGRTEAVELDGDTIHGETPVFLTGPGYRMRGNGLVATADGKNVGLTGGVTGTLQTEAR
jgi:hypothetical protein